MSFAVVKPKLKHVLGIETSCDETGVAIYKDGKGIISEALHSQIEIHAEYGGVVPELASRDHIRKLNPLVKTCLNQSGLTLNDLDAVAFTQGPGLAGALLTGAAFAKSLAWQLDIPSIGINHLEAHLLSALLEHEVQFPFLGLLISGGHTLLVKANSMGSYKVLGQTVDDAIGESFDKTAKLMGLGYPGGASLSKLAKTGDIKRFSFTRPMTHKAKFSLNFSFSGLKTEVRNTYLKYGENEKANIAKAFEQACVDTLVIKVEHALKNKDIKQLVVAGGVAANQPIRQALAILCKGLGIKLAIPSQRLCTDNGEMVAYAGWLHLQQSKSVRHTKNLNFDVFPRWSLEDINT